MIRKKISLSYYSLVLMGCLLSLSTFAQSDLIQREIFFKGRSQNSFQCDQKGETFYFRRSSHPRILYFAPTDKPGHLDSLSFEEPLRTYNVSGAHPVLLWGNPVKVSLYKEGALENISLPDSSQRVSLLKRGSGASQYLFALRIETPDENQSGIWILNLRNGALNRKYELPEPAAIFLDGDLNLVAGYGPNTLGGNNFYHYKAKTKKWEPFWKNPWSMDNLVGGFSQILTVSDDGREVWFTSNKNSDKCRLYCYDTQAGQTREIASDPMVDLLPYGCSVDTKGRLSSVLGMFADSRRQYLDAETGKDFVWLAKQGLKNVGFLHALDQDRKWLIREVNGAPGRVLLYDRVHKTLQTLASSHPELAKHKLASRTAYAVNSFDGLKLPVHVYLPAGSDQNGDGIPDQPLPTIMYVHGGPWVGIFHWNGNFHWRNFQLLADRGYAVINCEFRGGTGLGKDFYERSEKKWGTDMNQDLKSIADWAVQEGITQKGKLGMWGWSYGGYAAFSALAFTPDTYQCGLAMYGISDLDSFGRIPFANTDFWHNWVGDPFDPTEQKMLREVSPLFHIDKIKAPLLLTTGSKDARVPQEQMDRMAEALARKGQSPIYFYYPEEVHDYRDPGSWISFWAIAEKFLQDHLGGKYQNYPADLDEGNYRIVEGGEFIEGLR